MSALDDELKDVSVLGSRELFDSFGLPSHVVPRPDQRTLTPGTPLGGEVPARFARFQRLIEAAFDRFAHTPAPWFDGQARRWAVVLAERGYADLNARLADLQRDRAELERESQRLSLRAGLVSEWIYVLALLADKEGEGGRLPADLLDGDAWGVVAARAVGDRSECQVELSWCPEDEVETALVERVERHVIRLRDRGTIGDALEASEEALAQAFDAVAHQYGLLRVVNDSALSIQVALFLDRAYGITMPPPAPGSGGNEALPINAVLFPDEEPVYERFKENAVWLPYGRLIMNANTEALRRQLSGSDRLAHIQQRLADRFGDELAKRGRSPDDFTPVQLSRVRKEYLEGNYD